MRDRDAFDVERPIELQIQRFGLVLAVRRHIRIAAVPVENVLLVVVLRREAVRERSRIGEV